MIPPTMTVIEILELVGKLGAAAIDAVKSGSTHVDSATLFANHFAGEAKNIAGDQSEADAKYGKKPT